MSTSSVFVIVGGGLAGVKAAEALRDKGFDGRVVLFSAEDHLPYDRPPLSKDFLAAKTSAIAEAYSEADRRLGLSDFTVHNAAWYREHDIEVRLGVRIAAVEPAAHAVRLADGATERYDKLLLATGSRARVLPLPGHDAERVHYLRTFDDAAALEAALVDGASLAVVGAGWIGLEVAASARQRGVAVSVVERSQLPLLSALGDELGEMFAELHREHDVDLRLSAQVAEITTADGRATGLTLGDGSSVAADTVLVAAGAEPNIELAEQAGLVTDGGGVAVDASLRTSDPDIYAAGDITAAQNRFLAARIRTEHWANALKQPAVAAAGMLGEHAQYDELPYFFTDQYELGMEYAGYAPAYQQVVFRGDVGARKFIAFWLDAQHRVLAGMNVNVWGVIDDIKALIRQRLRVNPDELADPQQPLPGLLAR
jgi:3-phenylpropionate/trans-cinnamate dioxygenase ferredoxin reductase subunit